MKKLLLATIAGLAIAAPARAEVKAYAVNGAWANFAGIADDGNAVCGITTGSEPFGLAIKVFNSDNYLTIHLTKTNWNIPKGSPIQTVVQVDHAVPWQAVGAGDGNAIELRLGGQENIQTFVNEVRYGLKLVVAFPQGNEAPWVANLQGSGASMKEMGTCVGMLANLPGAKKPAAAPTQPFAPQPIPTEVPAMAPGRRT